MKQIELQDHASRSLCLAGMSKTLCKICYRKGHYLGSGDLSSFAGGGAQYTAARLSLGVPSRCAHRTMLRLACMGHIQCESDWHW